MRNENDQVGEIYLKEIISFINNQNRHPEFFYPFFDHADTS